MYSGGGDTNFAYTYREVKSATHSNITFTVRHRALCNWAPGQCKIRCSRCDTNSGRYDTWIWEFGYQYLNCSGTGNMYIRDTVAGGNPGTSKLTYNYDNNDNFNFTIQRDGRHNMIAEIDIMAGFGIYLT